MDDASFRDPSGYVVHHNNSIYRIINKNYANIFEKATETGLFKKLVDDSSVMTTAGVPVRFVMTEESDPGMAQFKGKVQGFPTYMAVVKNNDSVVSMRELNVSSRTADAIKQAAMEINLSEGYGNRQQGRR